MLLLGLAKFCYAADFGRRPEELKKTTHSVLSMLDELKEKSRKFTDDFEANRKRLIDASKELTDVPPTATRADIATPEDHSHLALSGDLTKKFSESASALTLEESPSLVDAIAAKQKEERLERLRDSVGKLTIERMNELAAEINRDLSGEKNPSDEVIIERLLNKFITEFGDLRTVLSDVQLTEKVDEMFQHLLAQVKVLLPTLSVESVPFHEFASTWRSLLKKRRTFLSSDIVLPASLIGTNSPITTIKSVPILSTASSISASSESLWGVSLSAGGVPSIYSLQKPTPQEGVTFKPGTRLFRVPDYVSPRTPRQGKQGVEGLTPITPNESSQGRSGSTAASTTNPAGTQLPQDSGAQNGGASSVGRFGIARGAGQTTNTASPNTNRGPASPQANREFASRRLLVPSSVGESVPRIDLEKEVEAHLLGTEPPEVAPSSELETTETERPPIFPSNEVVTSEAERHEIAPSNEVVTSEDEFETVRKRRREPEIAGEEIQVEGVSVSYQAPLPSGTANVRVMFS